MVEISVLIPHCNDLRQLATCLDLLGRQTLERDRFEIIIADNNSSCGLAAVEQVAGQRARVISAPEPGAGPTRNKAAAIARSDNLVFIDSDCRPGADWLRQGLCALRDHPIVGGPVLMAPRDPQHVTDVEAFDMVFGFNALRYLQHYGFLGSGNLFVRRTVFEQVGGFRSGVSEDVDWSRRARMLGYTLHHAPGAIVAHPARREWGDLVRKWERATRESYLLAREQQWGTLRWLLRSWAVLASPLPHSALALRSERLSSRRQRWGAIRTLFRIRSYRFVEAHRIAMVASIQQARLAEDRHSPEPSQADARYE